MSFNLIFRLFLVVLSLIASILGVMLIYVLIGAFIETIHDDYIVYRDMSTRVKPKARCYCCDCIHYNTDTHLCSKHGYGRYAVDHFCKDAYPVRYIRRRTDEDEVEAGGESK